MSYVLVNPHTQVRHAPRNHGVYATEAAAKAALTRYKKTGVMDQNVNWQVMSYTDYVNQVPMITVTNLMSGKPVQIRADTPLCCDPSSETYWSQ
jgi:hypothetical protein